MADTRLVIEFNLPDGEGEENPVVLSISGMNVLVQNGLKFYTQRGGSIFLVGNADEEIEVQSRRFLFTDDDDGGYQVTVDTTNEIDTEAFLNKLRSLGVPPEGGVPAVVPPPVVPAVMGEPDPEHVGPPVAAVAPPAPPPVVARQVAQEEEGIPPEFGQLQDPGSIPKPGNPMGPPDGGRKPRKTRVRQARKTKRRRTLRKH